MANHPEGDYAQPPDALIQGTAPAAGRGDTTYQATVAVAASRSNPNIIYATATADPDEQGHTDLFRTQNGGRTWINLTRHVPDEIIVDIAVAPEDDRTVYVVTLGAEQGHVFKTTNGGVQWTNITGDLPDVPTWAVFTHPTLPEAVAIINDVGSFASVEGGATWTRFVPEAPEASAATPPAPREPARLALPPVAPNPARDATTVTFQLARAGAVRVALYDVLGREVVVLVDGEREAGAHSIPLSTARLAAGAYILQLKTGEHRLTQRVTVVR